MILCLPSFPDAQGCSPSSFPNTLTPVIPYLNLCLSSHLTCHLPSELVLASFLNPQASFLGHLCGILAGMLHVRAARSLRGWAPELRRLWRSLAAPLPGRVGGHRRQAAARQGTGRSGEGSSGGGGLARGSARPVASAPPLTDEELRQRRLQRLGEWDQPRVQRWQQHEQQPVASAPPWPSGAAGRTLSG